MKIQHRFTLNPTLQGLLFTMFCFAFLFLFVFMFKETTGFDQIMAVMGLLIFGVCAVFSVYYYLLIPKIGMSIEKEGISVFGILHRPVLIYWSDIDKICHINTITNLNNNAIMRFLTFKVISAETIGIYISNPTRYADLLTGLKNSKLKKLWTKTAWKTTADFPQDIPDLSWPLGNTDPSKMIANFMQAVEQYAKDKIQSPVIKLYQGFSLEEAEEIGYYNPSLASSADVVKDSVGNTIPPALKNQYQDINELNQQIEALTQKVRSHYGDAVVEKALNAYFYITIWRQRNILVKFLHSAFLLFLAIFGSFVLFVMVFSLGVKTIPITFLAFIYLLILDRNWGVIIYPTKLINKLKQLPFIGDLDLPWYVTWVVIPFVGPFIADVILMSLFQQDLAFLNPDLILVSYVIFVLALFTVGAIIRLVTYRQARVIVEKYSQSDEMMLEVYNHWSQLRTKMQSFKLSAFEKGVEVTADFGDEG